MERHTDNKVAMMLVGSLQCIMNKSSQSHLGTAHHYLSQQRMHSSAACASCAMSTADKSSYSAAGMHACHISPLTHWSLTITFTLTLTLTLLTLLIPLQPLASILQA